MLEVGRLGEDTLGIREDLLGRAAKESAFNKLDLYLSAVEMEIFAVTVGTGISRVWRGEPNSVLMQLKYNFI